MKTIIAEKPSVAREIAKVLKCSGSKDGYIEGNGYYITWAFGHLVELAKPDYYGAAQWTLDSLPILPEPFQLVNKENYDSKTKSYKKDSGALKQFNTIKSLFSKSDSIIVATDAGREGELIFRYIYALAECRKPFERLWISSLTNEAIEKGFKSLQPGKNYDNLFYAAKSRNESDWLVGMNATRAMSITSKRTLSIGRVQTPTLALICKRYLGNKYFKPVPFFELHATQEKTGITFLSKTSRIETKDGANNLLASLQQATFSKVANITKTPKTVNPPLLFDLGALQQEANKKHGYTADQTLQAAQALYEKKHISYPRTSSRYISEDIFREIPSLFLKQPYPEYKQLVKLISDAGLNKRSVNDSKITDHHAIIVTDNFPDGLSDTLQPIYDLIMEQMIKSFGEPTKKEITDIELLIEQTPFYAKGTKIIVSGWESYFKAVKDESEEQEDEQNLPHLQQGDTCRLTELKVCERKTNAPPLHTEASLLKSMETAGKEIADEELRQAMKDTGIGTPATRASIIETLLLRSYIERKGKTIIPTMLGLEVYNLVKEKDFASPELTGNWESRLAKMEKGSLTREQFMDDIVAYTKNITDDLQKLGKQVVPNNFQAESEHKCPKCSKQIRETKYNWQCDCGFKLSKIILEKQLKEKHLKEILKHKKTFIKGFKSQKTGKLFDATLALKDDYTTEFVFKK